MGELVRIQKVLAGWGVASRRAIERMIEDRQIILNGNIIVEPGTMIDPDNPPVITVKGRPVTPPVGQEYSIYMLNKPEGVVTTLQDELGRKTILNYLPPGKRLYPIGRLDCDSTGLLLITDHGELTHRLLHPSFKVEKEYIVKITGAALSAADQEQFCSGLIMEDGKTAPCQLKATAEPQTYSVIIKEGKKRQIRRMFACLGRKVITLHRVRVGPVCINDLRSGELRLLSAKEKADLLNAAGLLKRD